MSSSRYQVYNLEETYPELGEYTFKVVLNPRYFKSGHGFDVEVSDSDLKPIRSEVEIWGRKINVTFQIALDTADGVARALVRGPGGELCNLQWWIIKP